MDNSHSDANGSQDSPATPIVTKCDEFGRPVLVIEPAGKPPTITFYGLGPWKESSEEENDIESLNPPAG